MKDKKNSRPSRFAIGALVAGAMLAATLVLAGKIFSTSEGPKVDRNVPGATTGPGKSSLND
jgi:hypothetical protein